MVRRKNSSSPRGQQPEALNTFNAASRSGSVKPKEQGLTARSETRPDRKDPAEKSKAAAEVLKNGAEGRSRTSAGAKKASDR
jgi:hypothetical protein